MFKKFFFLSLLSLLVFSACLHQPVDETPTDDADETASDNAADTDTDDGDDDDDDATNNDDDKPTGNTDSTSDDTVANDTPSDNTASDDTAPAVKEIAISGNEFSFSPSSIDIAPGEKVKITFRNDGNFPHNIAIKELGIASPVIGGGETATLEFTASDAGTLTMYCSVASHEEAGMVGTVTIQ
ncbi:cupredoxin domain-containing protein [Candidatus Peregrinibacteria bacterium]|nr:cupredoxin domain-containing protein [Candidatus Peregrinibacteria bacterium]